MNLGNIKEAQKMLVDMANSQGSDKVSVAKVRQAVAVKQGKVPPQRVAGNLVSAPKNAVVNLDDLRKGGKDLIAAIGVNRDETELDELSAGLNKVLTYVERLRAKASKKAQSSVPATKTPAVKQQPKPNGNGNGNGGTTKKSPGDLRGL
jgi:sensor histidine kinase regulating citrate/malate metabolism